MRELYSLVDKQMVHCNPIAVAELMSKTEKYWYCPFAYGYSNYSREGYAKHLLHYADLVTFSNGEKLRSTIGGTGMAISSGCKHIEVAVAFAKMVASPLHQSTFYVQHGGQPGHGAAWKNQKANELTHQYFKNVYPVMDRGYIRPRYNGYLHFQDHAGDPLHEYLLKGGNPKSVLQKMNLIYSESLQITKSQVSV
jgi:multiple sugar transport system substrate-binding protein